MTVNESQSVDQITRIESALYSANIEHQSASEVHGLIVGAICNHLKTGLSPNLLTLIEPQASSQDSHFKQVETVLYDLYRETSEQLFESKEGFDLVLPEDEQYLSERVNGVASWCKGFLLGLLYNDKFSLDQLPESGAEIARDLLEISEAAAGIENEDGSASSEQQEEWALAELHEYVKVGAQLIFEFIYSERSADAPSQQQ